MDSGAYLYWIPIHPVLGPKSTPGFSHYIKVKISVTRLHGLQPPIYNVKGGEMCRPGVAGGCRPGQTILSPGSVRQNSESPPKSAHFWISMISSLYKTENSRLLGYTVYIPILQCKRG